MLNIKTCQDSQKARTGSQDASSPALLPAPARQTLPASITFPLKTAGIPLSPQTHSCHPGSYPAT